VAVHSRGSIMTELVDPVVVVALESTVGLRVRLAVMTLGAPNGRKIQIRNLRARKFAEGRGALCQGTRKSRHTGETMRITRSRIIDGRGGSGTVGNKFNGNVLVRNICTTNDPLTHTKHCNVFICQSSRILIKIKNFIDKLKDLARFLVITAVRRGASIKLSPLLS
jgi:hypothetical protein